MLHRSDKERILTALTRTLAQRPVPQYSKDSGRIYGMPFMGCDIRFRASIDTVTVTDIATEL